MFKAKFQTVRIIKHLFTRNNYVKNTLEGPLTTSLLIINNGPRNIGDDGQPDEYLGILQPCRIQLRILPFAIFALNKLLQTRYNMKEVAGDTNYIFIRIQVVFSSLLKDFINADINS